MAPVFQFRLNRQVHVVGHSRDTLGLGTPGTLRGGQSRFFRGVPGDQAETGRGVVDPLPRILNTPSPQVKTTYKRAYSSGYIYIHIYIYIYMYMYFGFMYVFYFTCLSV